MSMPSNETEKYDVLLTYEVKNREIENLCLVKRELERRGYKVGLRMQYNTFFETEKPVEADLVVVPGYYRPRAQFYSASHTVKTEKILNMLWEQIFNAKEEERSDIVRSIKPWGRSAAHIAWGRNMHDRLVNEWGVQPDHVFITGQIALDFLKGPLRNYYQSREEIFSQYGIPTEQRVHLFISSLSYVDIDMRVARNTTSDGNLEGPMKFADISVRTRKTLLEWFERILEENSDDIIIYRPHPEEKSVDALFELAERQPRFRVISDFSVKQWILICDNIYSWLSTSIAEVYAAGKGCAVLRPVEIPYLSDIRMYHEAKQVVTYDAFREAFAERNQGMAINEDSLRRYYYIDKDKYAYELVCDAIETVLHDDKYKLNQPLKNPFQTGIFNKERMANRLKCMIASSGAMERIAKGNFLKGSKFRELLDDVFYVKAKLEKNHASDEEISVIMQKIDAAFAKAEGSSLVQE